MIAIDDNVAFLASFAQYANGEALLPAHKTLVISKLKYAILALDKETHPIISVCQTDTASAFHRDLSDVLDELKRDSNIVLNFPGIIYLKDNGYTHLEHADPTQFPLPGTPDDDVTVKFTGTPRTQSAQQTSLSLAIDPRPRRTGIFVVGTGPFYNGYPSGLPPLPASRKLGLFASLAFPASAPHSIASVLYSSVSPNHFPIVPAPTRNLFTLTPEQRRIMLAGLEAFPSDGNAIVVILDSYDPASTLPLPASHTATVRIQELDSGEPDDDDSGYIFLDKDPDDNNPDDTKGDASDDPDPNLSRLTALLSEFNIDPPSAADPLDSTSSSPRALTPSFLSGPSSRNNSGRNSPAQGSANDAEPEREDDATENGRCVIA